MESNVYTAAVLQMSASAVFKKAKEMGLMKVAKSKTMERAEYISKHFQDSSYAEMAEKLGVSKACVYQCVRQLGLERNKAVNASVASRVRKELLQRERPTGYLRTGSADENSGGVEPGEVASALADETAWLYRG